jgi:hypothetical protein
MRPRNPSRKDRDFKQIGMTTSRPYSGFNFFNLWSHRILLSFTGQNVAPAGQKEARPGSTWELEPLIPRLAPVVDAVVSAFGRVSDAGVSRLAPVVMLTERALGQPASVCKRSVSFVWPCLAMSHSTDSALGSPDPPPEALVCGYTAADSSGAQSRGTRG